MKVKYQRINTSVYSGDTTESEKTCHLLQHCVHTAEYYATNLVEVCEIVKFQW